MDFDPRDDRLGPMKLARTDSFPLKMQIAGNGTLGSLVRSNSMVSDGRLGCSPTNSTASDGALLGGGDSNFMTEGRLMRNESSIVTYPGLAARTMQAYPHQSSPFPFRSSGLPLSMGRDLGGHYGLHESEPVVFTASQLRELQHHALIFKYLMSGVSVPPELVYPIRTSVATLAAGMTPGAHHLASWWGNYHLGYANSTDPEPGRCRRTDGKKWRCSRDVVPDQKYCERHMHRGRHRQRKPPESTVTTAGAPNSSNCTGNSNLSSTPANNTTANATTLINTPGLHHTHSMNAAATSTLTCASSAQPSPSVVSPSSSVNFAAARAAAAASASASSPVPSSLNNNACFRTSSVAFNLQQQQQQQQRPPASALGIRSLSGSPTGGLSIGHFNQLAGLSAKDLRYLNGDLGSEQTFFSDNSGSMRGLGQESPVLSGLSVMSSAVNNPLRVMHSKQQQHSFLGGGGGGGGGFDQAVVGRDSECQPLRHFFDDWPRGSRGSSLGPWSEVDDDGSNNRSSSTTQLSISIPAMAASDFTTSTTGGSPRGKLALSPLKLSMSRGNAEDDPLGVDHATQMGLGVGNMGLGINEDHQRHNQNQHQHQQQQQQQHSTGNSWIPVAWESSVGGPLAEVLQSSSNTPRGCKSSGLNLMTDGWESSPRDSPRMASPSAERGGAATKSSGGALETTNSTD